MCLFLILLTPDGHARNKQIFQFSIKVLGKGQDRQITGEGEEAQWRMNQTVNVTMCTVKHLTEPDASGEETAKYLYIPWSHQRKPAMQGISVLLSGLISDVFASVMGEKGRIPVRRTQ